jgi:hypothetical protein
MITGITIENFKGVREPIKLDFRPITLLFGANSAGKSTVLHALHYAREIFERHNLDADQTIAGGRYIDLGGYRRLAHREDELDHAVTIMPIRLRIDIELSDQDLPMFPFDIDGLIARAIGESDRYRDEMRSDWDDIRWMLDYDFNDLFKEVRTAAVELEIAWNELRDCPYIATNTIYLNGEPFVCLQGNQQLRGASVCFKFRLDGSQQLDTPQDISALNHKSLRLLSEQEQERQELPLDNRPLLEVLLDQCEDLLGSGGWDQIDLDGLKDALPPLDTDLVFSPIELSSSSGQSVPDSLYSFHSDLARELVKALSRYIVGPCQLIRDQLKHFRYLGPLRETLPRSYTTPRFHDPARWASGLGAWDMLDTGPDELIEEVGRWLGDEDKLDSGCSIERRKSVTLDYSHPVVRKMMSGRAFDDVDQDWAPDLSGVTKTRMVVVGNSGIELHPHEVGIGISQVVPVIVTALDDEERLLAIEQPELHVHPRLQAAMGDLFIEAITTKKHRLIIETHSEHLILRLLRRIRETEANDAPDGRKLRTHDVAIYYLKQEEGTTRVTRIDVDTKGEFIQPWPDDFFEIDFFERFPDAR